MRISLGQVLCSQCSATDESCFASCTQNSASTNWGTPFETSSLPLSLSAPILTDVSAIPCPSGQTCSFLANVPDWAVYGGVLGALFGFIILVKPS